MKNKEVKVKIHYDDTPDQVAEAVLGAVQRVAPEVNYEQLEGGDGFEEFAISNTSLEFLEYVENNYYYNSGCWINSDTDTVENRTEIFQAYLNSIS